MQLNGKKMKFGKNYDFMMSEIRINYLVQQQINYP